MVPIAIGALDAPASGSETQVQPGRTATDGPTRAIHRVNDGDTLWQIARSHDVDMRQLAAWNGLSVETVLQPGQRLTVYRGRAARSRLAAPTRSAESSDTGPSESIHVVEYGDTLSEIAQRHGTTVLELTQVNRIEESAVLRPGQRLRLLPAAYSSNPGDPGRIRYRVKRGDSLWEISRQFGVSVASLRKWNRLPADEPAAAGPGTGRALDTRTRHLSPNPQILLGSAPHRTTCRASHVGAQFSIPLSTGLMHPYFRAPISNNRRLGIVGDSPVSIVPGSWRTR